MNTLTALKQQEIISIREFIHQLSKITDFPKQKIYTLVKNGRKVGTYIPAKYEDEVFSIGLKMEKKKYHSLFDNYKQMAFTGGDPNLSQKIDQILYGKN